MAYKDLRSFLETLEKEGQLIRIKDEVMPVVVVFTNIGSSIGTFVAFPVIVKLLLGVSP